MRNKVFLIEAVIVLAGFLLGWIYLAGQNGYPISNDEILYMHTALNTEPLAIILNRYGHIYAQKLFLMLNESDSFRAANVYWGLLMSASMTLSYVCTRLLTGSRQHMVAVVTGVLAVVFFMAQPYLLEYPGVIYADYGAMLMVVLAAVLYLLAQRSVRFQRPLLALFGLVFFFGMKTKESSLVIGVLVLGLGFESDGRYRLPRLLRNILIVLGGMLIGQIVFMIIDNAVLGDALFGLRPENWQALLTFNLREGWERLSGNYFQGLAQSETLILSVLALLAAAQPEAWNTPQKKILWLLPIAVIGFLSLSMISGAWGAIPRYLLVMSPVLSVLAACYFYGLLSRSSPPVRWFAASLIIGWIVTQVILVPWASTRYGWDAADFRRSVLMPLILLSLGVLAVVGLLRGKLLVLGWSLCIGLVIVPAAVQVIDYLNGGYAPSQDRIIRWRPYIAFGSLIEPSDEMRLLASPNINMDYGYGGRNSQGDMWMFNLYFRSDLAQSQFIQETVTPLELSRRHPTYALMTVNHWRSWEDAEQLALLDETQLFAENSQRLIFINYGPPAAEVQPGVQWFPLAAGYRNCRIAAQEAEPGVYEYRCHALDGDDYNVLGWTYLAGDGSIGTSVADANAVTGDQLRQMAYSFAVYPESTN